MSEKSAFERLAAINVADHIEKKNGLSYLSWAWAVDQLLRSDPKATWSYNDAVRYGETMMVSCTVTAFEKPMTMQLPVMDYRNKAIANPDAFAVNTAMMRCLVKAIALHGLGLYIYAGEDLPLEDEEETKKKRLPKLTEEEAEAAYNEWEADKSALAAASTDGVADNEAVTKAWFLRESNVRTAIKSYIEKLKQKEG